MSIGNKRSVPFNFAMNFIMKLLGPVCSAVSYPYAFRAIGQTEMGRVAFTISVVSLFLLIANLGIPTYGVRECAKVRDEEKKLSRLCRELIAIQFLTTFASVLLLALSVIAVPQLRGEWRLFLVQGAILLFQGLSTEWLFQGLERYGFLALRSSLVKVASVLLIILLVKGPEDYLIYCVLTAGTAAASVVLNLPALKKIIGPGKKGEKLELGRHIRPALVFFAQAAAITIYTSFDSALLGFIKGDTAVGAYDAAVKVKLVLVYFITSLGTVLLPRFSYYIGEKREEDFGKGVELSASFLWLTALPLTAFFFVLGRDCLELLYGSVTDATRQCLRILVLTLIPIGITNLLGVQVLTPLGREKTVMWAEGSGAIVNLAADLVLISLYGPLGAAIGTLISELAVLIVELAGSRGLKLKVFHGREILMVLGAVLVASAILLGIRYAVSGLLAKVMLGIICFFFVNYGILFTFRYPLLMQGREKLRKYLKRQMAPWR